MDIHIPSDRISKDLTRAIEDAIALAAINEKEKELENAANINTQSFDWSVGHVSIITFELWQSNKRLKKMLEQEKQKWRDCSMRTSRSKTKRLMSQGIMNWSVIDE